MRSSAGIPEPSGVRSLIVLAACACAALAAGCRGRSTGPSAAQPATPSVRPEMLLESAVELLQPSKGSANVESYRIAEQHLNEYVSRLRRSGGEPIPPLDADIRRQLRDRLTAQQVDDLSSPLFDRGDMRHIQSCFLERDITDLVTEGIKDDLAKAGAIFDWVVRNVQLVPDDDPPDIRVIPWVTLILGQGDTSDRAWVFMQLLRQVGIESVLVAYEDPASAQKELVPWAPAVLLDGALYLFDTTIGLPVPGPDGTGVATLAQATENPELLRQLDVDPMRPYRVHREQLEKLVVLLESTPAYWAFRMRFLEDRLAGRNRAVLWSDLVALSERVRAATGDDVVQDLWSIPHQAEQASDTADYQAQLQQLLSGYAYYPPAFEARSAQLRGKFDDAIRVYMETRLGPDTPVQLGMSGKTKEVYQRLREDSTYFLGVLKFEQREPEVAARWLGKQYLEHYSEGRWVAGAHYLLGRCAEAQEKPEEAIAYYTTPDPTPQELGNLLRARRLGWQPAASEQASKQ